MKQTFFKTWLMAARPRTLYAAVAPVVIGTAMAFGDGVHYWPMALTALFGALTIQIGTNLANDYFDFKKGADTHERKGPTRVTQAGLISPGTVKRAAFFVFALSGLAYICMVFRGGWPIAVLGILAVFSAIFYTAGPRPLGYMGFGEVLVLIFFGPVALGGTYYVQSLKINAAVILAGLACGLLSSAVLVVNNLRDIETDKASGKKTLAVRFGGTFARAEYLAFIVCASFIPVIIWRVTHAHIWILLSTVIFIAAIPSIRVVYSMDEGPPMNQVLAHTCNLLMIFSILFSVGWIL